MLSIPIRLLAYFIRIFIIFHAYLLVTISLLKFSSASLETMIILMWKLLVGVATLSLMPALWNVHCKPIPCNDYRDLPVY